MGCRTIPGYSNEPDIWPGACSTLLIKANGDDEILKSVQFPRICIVLK